MNFRSSTILAAFMLAVIATIPAPVHACSCMPKGEPCQATWTVDAVFAGTVRSIERTDHEELGHPYQAEVEAVAAELAGAPRPFREPARTDASGWFELRGLSPGDYVVGVNLTRPPQQPAPFPATFFAGTRLPGEAGVIELKPGDRKHIGVLRLGERLAEYALQGCVLWAENQPAPTARVSLSAFAASRSTHIGSAAETDGAGCFSTRVHHGVRYTVRAWAARSDDPRAEGQAEATFIVTGPPAPLRLILTVRR